MPRRLARVTFALDHVIEGTMPPLPESVDGDGLWVRSLPLTHRAHVLDRFGSLKRGQVSTFRRHYIDMEGTFENYLTKFSAKSRSTMKRKQRNLAAANGGKLDIREYRGVEGLEDFLKIALPLAEMTYQTRLLRSGLPCDDRSLAKMRAMAEQDRLRLFVLHLDGRPAAYLYLPVKDRTVIYGHLGFDPRQAALSPGSVLQMAALERLFAERKFRYFDFTEGDGPHKSRFSTGNVPCETFILYQPTLANITLFGLQRGLSVTSRSARQLAARVGMEKSLRRLIQV